MADRKVNFRGAGPPAADATGVTVTYEDTLTGDLYTRTDGGPWTHLSDLVKEPPPPPPPPPPAGDAKQRFHDAMEKPHEGPLDGVPDDYDWAHRGRVGYGNNPGGKQAALAWGQVYSSGNTDPNAYVEVRNLTMFVKYSGQPWQTVTTTKPRGGTAFEGGYFKADFGGNQTDPGSSPVTLADGSFKGHPNPGYNMHFWTQGRTAIQQDIEGICTSYDARIVGSTTGRFVAGAGGDYWQTLTSGYPSNGDFAIGRHLLLSTEWKTLVCHTLTPQQIDTGQLPPVIFAGTVDPPPPPPPPTGGAWKTPKGRPIKVLFAGDSIVLMQAQAGNGLSTLGGRIQGNQIELVGPVQDGSVHHAGYGGSCADDANGRCQHNSGFHGVGVGQLIGGWVAAHHPDVVVLNTGTNDRYVQQPYNDAQMAAAVGRVVDAVHAVDPGCMVLASGLWMEYDASHNGDTNRAFNDLLRGECAMRAAAGKNVRYVFVYSAFSSSADFDAAGSVHPSPQGVDKLVAGAASALQALFLSSV